MIGEDADLFQGLLGYRRARGFFLYNPGKPRLLDLWRLGGRSFLGHRPAGFTLELKNILAQGGTVPFPSPWTGRILTLLNKTYPQWPHKTLLNSPEEVAIRTGVHTWADPGLGQFGKAELLRPGVSPGPSAEFLKLVNADAELGPEIILSKTAIGKSANLAPFRLSAGIQGVAGLTAWEKGVKPDFTPWAQKGWKNLGPYLSLAKVPVNYKSFFEHFYSHGFLLPPDSGLPLILPLTWSPGELKGFQKASQEWQWTS